MATILGLHYGHHGSACIVKDGKLVAAVSTERISRNKFCFGVTNELLDYLFTSQGISIPDIDYIGLSDWNDMFSFDTIKVYQDGKEIKCLWNSIYDNTCLNLEIEIRGKKIPGFYVGHQFCHAAAAFYTSPFDEAYCFSLDASGAKHKNNSLISYGNGKTFKALYCPGLMVGVAYGFFTEFLGIGSQMLKAGSTMALAGYGKVIQKVLDNQAKYIDSCFFHETQDYHQWYIGLWKDLSGNERHFNSAESDKEKAQNIAATIQKIFEDAIIKCVNDIESGSVKNICLGGGSMLNCCTNSLVLKNSKFENVSLFPGCGDDGGCVGVALYVAHNILGEERHRYTNGEICYLGPDKEMSEPDYSYIAKRISEGKIIAWCNGRSEYGPRALGNRSILGDPRDYRTRERINFEIKHREWYRPLAPVVLEEQLEEWFDFPVASPFMLFTAPIREPQKIPAVNHVDNSARIQTVNEVDNPYYYRLVKEFYSITGVPVLVNTSLNGNGEPMVETDEEAINFFNKGLVDIMILNGKIYER
jgi:carbamoyltransferase